MLEKWLREERDEQQKRLTAAEEIARNKQHRRRNVKYFVKATAVEIANAKVQQIAETTSEEADTDATMGQAKDEDADAMAMAMAMAFGNGNENKDGIRQQQ